MGRHNRAFIESKESKSVHYCDVPRCDESMARHMQLMSFPQLWKNGEVVTDPKKTLLGNCNHNCWNCFCLIVRHDTRDVHLPIERAARRNAKVDTELLQKGVVV